ncbi:MAG: hypothetical protein IPK68_11130 [Bdellovibrionales bacterium]|nr:hypothetical protein [Bdellovibrionales bacterium]MBK8202838.1 hypothetical protein [Bdellovibrionales bacterium]
MKSPSQFEGVFLHRDPVDLRRGIPGLSQIVESAQMGKLNGKKSFRVLWSTTAHDQDSVF